MEPEETEDPEEYAEPEEIEDPEKNAEPEAIRLLSIHAPLFNVYPDLQLTQNQQNPSHVTLEHPAPDLNESLTYAVQIELPVLFILLEFKQKWPELLVPE